MNATRLRPLLLAAALVGMGGGSAGATLEFIDADRSVYTQWGSEEASAAPASEFGEFDEWVLIIGPFDFPLAEATQRSALGRRVWTADLRASADTDYETAFPEPGFARSEFSLDFQVNEAVDFRLAGRVGGYDGAGTVSLSGVFSVSGSTFFEEVGEFPVGPYGGERFAIEGTLQPGPNLLRAVATAPPNLGGYGVGDAEFSLEFIARTLPQWFELRELPPDSDLGSDDDGDLVPLFLEYALRLDPGLADAADAMLGFEINPATGAAELSYPAEREDLIYTPEWSTDGTNWSVEGIAKTAGDGEVIASFADPPAGGAFVMRLMVELR